MLGLNYPYYTISVILSSIIHWPNDTVMTGLSFSVFIFFLFSKTVPSCLHDHLCVSSLWVTTVHWDMRCVSTLLQCSGTLLLTVSDEEAIFVCDFWRSDSILAPKNFDINYADNNLGWPRKQMEDILPRMKFLTDINRRVPSRACEKIYACCDVSSLDLKHKGLDMLITNLISPYLDALT